MNTCVWLISKSSRSSMYHTTISICNRRIELFGIEWRTLMLALFTVWSCSKTCIRAVAGSIQTSIRNRRIELYYKLFVSLQHIDYTVPSIAFYLQPFWRSVLVLICSASCSNSALPELVCKPFPTASRAPSMSSSSSNASASLM